VGSSTSSQPYRPSRPVTGIDLLFISVKFLVLVDTKRSAGNLILAHVGTSSVHIHGAQIEIFSISEKGVLNVTLLHIPYH
jgi:hypothetical protein